jgi:2-polyprenyl-6-methoxyphenol hydroxylase-like FAD-dependent oxidoreductase
MTMPRTEFDVIIIGAGPAGLGLARSLAGVGLDIALIERQSRVTLEAPPFDGREIALTHQSAQLLRDLDAWDRIPATEISPMAEARVINGPFPHALRFHPTGDDDQTLAHLVPNYLIRRALFESVAACPNIHLFEGTVATGVETDQQGASVALGDGARLAGRLVVAADTRFSEMRRRMGIAARMRDFGKTMLVCRMAHDLPHHGVATEWFGYGQTIAMLPLNGVDGAPHVSSLVLTLPARQIGQLMALDADGFGAEITRRYQQRLGAMRLLAGDAAVGMHPVTAHGFNLGIQGARTLADLVGQAASSGRDIGAAPLLARFETLHRRATGPLYLATMATVLLYTDDRFPARVMRDAVIRAGHHLRPFRQAVTARLMKIGGPAAPRASRRIDAKPSLTAS